MTLQQRVWANKQRQGFNLDNVPMEFCLLMAELGEYCVAIDAGDDELISEELADVALFAYGLASMLGEEIEDLAMTAGSRLDFEFAPAVKAWSKLFESWKRGLQVRQPLDDFFRILDRQARMHDIELRRAVERKLTVIEKRVYIASAHGHVQA